MPLNYEKVIYEKKGKIAIITPELAKQRATKITNKKHIRITRKPPRITPNLPSLSQVRVKR